MMTFRTSVLLLAGLGAALAPAARPQQQTLTQTGTTTAGVRGGPAGTGGVTDVIDFESFDAGAIVTQAFGVNGSGPVLVDGFNPSFGGGIDAAVVFDSAMRTGGDSDLGTPNSDFGGPGVDGDLGDGTGGEAGSPFQNDAEQFHVLIIAEDLVDAGGDGLVDDPDDAAVPGSLFTFDYTALGGVTVNRMTIVDVEANRPNASVELFDAAMQSLGGVVLPQTGDNGLAIVDLGDVPGVHYMAVSLNGSGAIDDITYTTDPECDGKIGDRVWSDEDCDGIQDPGEPGLPDVGIILKDRFGGFVAETVTDEHGNYLFEGLCPGRYQICVVEETLPPGYTPSPCEVGDDDSIDSECNPHVTLIEPGECDLDRDFGYCPPPPEEGEGCTPGYWRQPHHYDSWPAPYTPDTLFGDVFEDAFPGMTLGEVVWLGGGGLNALGRHTVAALLNGASDDVDYGYSDQDVIDLFNATYPADDDDLEDLKDFFESLNDTNCPLN